MKAAFVVLAVTATPVLADPPVIQLRPVPLRTPPALVDRGTAATCEGQYVSTRRVIGTSTLSLVHDCGLDATSELVLHTSGGWFTPAASTIAFRGSGTTEDTVDITLVDEQLTSGKLADGTLAVVWTIETLERELTSCTSEPCRRYTGSSTHAGIVQVCTLDAAPACEHVFMKCTGSACPTARLSNGTLIVGAKRYQVGRP